MATLFTEPTKFKVLEYPSDGGSDPIDCGKTCQVNPTEIPDITRLFGFSDSRYHSKDNIAHAFFFKQCFNFEKFSGFHSELLSNGDIKIGWRGVPYWLLQKS